MSDDGEQGKQGRKGSYTCTQADEGGVRGEMSKGRVEQLSQFVTPITEESPRGGPVYTRTGKEGKAKHTIR